MDMKQGCEARTCSKDMQQGYANTLFKTLLSGFGLWNRISSVVRQKEKKRRICPFSFALGTFAFFRTLASRSRALFAKKARAPLITVYASQTQILGS
jgi:hypothetical protein